MLAMKLLKMSKISKDEKLLVLTGMDFNKKDELYEHAKSSLLKFKGDNFGGKMNTVEGATAAIKLEPAYVAESDETYWTGPYSGYGRGHRSRGRGGYRGGRGAPPRRYEEAG